MIAEDRKCSSRTWSGFATNFELRKGGYKVPRDQVFISYSHDPILSPTTNCRPFWRRQKKEGLVILWVYVSSCLYDETEIKDYQASHDILKPLDRLTPAEQSGVLAALQKDQRGCGERSRFLAGCGDFLSMPQSQHRRQWQKAQCELRCADRDWRTGRDASSHRTSTH